MSSLQVDNLQTYNSNPPVIKNVSGTEVGTFCRAWVNFNGTGTVAIRASFNVSSITDNGTGDFTVNFTSALADANYSFQGTASQAGTGSNGQMVSILASTAPTSSALRFRTQQDGIGVTDSDYVCLSIFR